MRIAFIFSLLLLASPMIAHADSSGSIVDLNSSTATADPSVSATPTPNIAVTPTPTAAPVTNPVTGASPLAGIVAILALGAAVALYVFQRRAE